MQFDFVVGNPPYNFPKVNGKSSGNVIWPEFVKIGKEYRNSDGYLVYVHPPLWRKPVDDNSDVDVRKHLGSVKFLSINSSQRGKGVFDAHTRFDWYLEAGIGKSKTLVYDINNNKCLVDLEEWPFIPNKNFVFIQTLLGEEDCQEVIFDSGYHASRDFVTNHKDNLHKYPVVHSTAKTGNNIKYSSKNDRGHFGTPKVIIGESGVGNPIVDLDGEYGMTQGAIGLVVDDREHAKKMVKALKSDQFQEVLDSCQWSGFRIDHRLFENFKKEWYNLILSSE